MNISRACRYMTLMLYLIAIFTGNVIAADDDLRSQSLPPVQEVSETKRLKKFKKRQEEMNREKVSFFKNHQEDVGKFVSVPGGCYEMGDRFGDGSVEEKPVHEVCIKDFYISKYEVTQKEWKELMSSFLKSNNPSCFHRCDNCPVERVTWNQAQEFIRKLRKKTAVRYRLPAEAEWEYAARSGGKQEKYAGTRSESEFDLYAWYGGNSKVRTHPVGQKKPNGLGLYDMSGNVKEWVVDWYAGDYYDDSPKENPKGPKSGEVRVLRGGSWGSQHKHIRTSTRIRSLPDRAYCGNGFRLAVSASGR